MGIIDEAFSIGMSQVPEEIKGLVSFLESLEPNHAMEIGTDRGGTFYLLCKLASGKKVSVDLPNHNWSHGVAVPNDEQLKSWASDVYVIRGDSHANETKEKVREALAGDLLDFLFIDGDHSYEGVKQDFEMYKEFVRPGGYVAFHDIVDSQRHRDMRVFVRKLWDELSGEKIEFVTQSEWAGIGVIKVE